MSCSFLTGRYVESCSATKEVYVPSSFELAEYCKCSRYKMCPFYAGHMHASPTDLESAVR